MVENRLRIPYIRFRSETGKKWEFRRLNDYPLEHDCRECTRYKCEKIQNFRRLQKTINAKIKDIYLKRYQPRQLSLEDRSLEDALWKEVDDMFLELGVAIDDILKSLRKRNHLQKLYLQDKIEHACFS